ncbi:MAG: endoglucanase [Lachnospiraceae bacterium]
MKQIAYQYHNLPIPGGGYVTGILYHPQKKDLLYIRTDIGGTYRFDAEKQRWKNLTTHVTMMDLSETYPIALALDVHRPEMLYIACGENKEKSGILAVSEDFGETFIYEKIPVRIHGNLNGRGTGERLLVDCSDSATLYFASQQEGLWITRNRGRNWTKVTALGEEYLTFVGQISKHILLVGSAGVSTKVDNMRGISLYVSYDGGNSFEALETPQNHELLGFPIDGLVAQRFAVDKHYLYVTFAATGRRSYVWDMGYSCDSGDSIDGHIVRYPLIYQDEVPVRLGAMEEITPGSASAVTGIDQEFIEKGDVLDYGFSGISVSAQTEGMLVATSLVKDDGDSIFCSTDYGVHWKQILYELKEGNLQFRTSYMLPEYNGGYSILHWLSDIKINPFDDNEAWFNSGTGVFRILHLRDEQPIFTDWCDGLEETVHLNVYSLPAGKTQVLDIVGDLGGFAFEELDKPCVNSFSDAAGNRYITCINADFSDCNPQNIVVTPRGNWRGKTKGGLILSKDGGKTFTRLPMPWGLSEEIDGALHLIEQPNVNSGWAAMSPDAQNIVWSIAEGIRLPAERMIVSQDGGIHFTCAHVHERNPKRQEKGSVKVFSDRMDNQLFYGFGEQGQFYVSCDGGKNFYQQLVPSNVPKVDFGLIDTMNHTEIRGEAGKSGIFYIAMGEHGLWKLCYEKETGKSHWKRLTPAADAVYRVGLGLGKMDGDYITESKAIYLCGRISGQYGFFRSLDECASFECINHQKQMFGEINSIDGDCRMFGRFYVATGSNGLLYGEPVKKREDCIYENI